MGFAQVSFKVLTLLLIFIIFLKYEEEDFLLCKFFETSMTGKQIFNSIVSALMLSSDLLLSVPSGHFPTKILCAFLVSPP
jgi:hypothetical protein